MILGLVISIVLCGLIAWYAFREQGRRYQQIITILTNDRDAARNEAKVFRNLLFPVMAKAEGAASTVDSAASGEGRVVAGKVAPSVVAAPKTVDEIWALKIPYREKFKLLLKLNNSKQVRTDALASALAKQKPHTQEKQNVAV